MIFWLTEAALIFKRVFVWHFLIFWEFQQGSTNPTQTSSQRLVLFLKKVKVYEKKTFKISFGIDQPQLLRMLNFYKKSSYCFDYWTRCFKSSTFLRAFLDISGQQQTWSTMSNLDQIHTTDIRLHKLKYLWVKIWIPLTLAALNLDIFF